MSLLKIESYINVNKKGRFGYVNSDTKQTISNFIKITCIKIEKY